MTRFSLLLVLCFFSCTAATTRAKPTKPATRPPISGIAHVRLHVSHMNASAQFYRGILRMMPLRGGCQTEKLRRFWVGGGQFVELDSSPFKSDDLVEEIAFSTPDLKAMREFLLSKGVEPQRIVSGTDGPCFAVTGPEGHQITFVQSTKIHLFGHYPRISANIIHAGLVVHDRAAEDRFFKDLLGFRSYWHGGMKDDVDDWVALQVPDGTDWIEYMLNISPNADHHTLGVMNQYRAWRQGHTCDEGRAPARRLEARRRA